LYVAQVVGSQVSAIDIDSGDIETISPMGGAIVGPDDLVFDDEGNLYFTEITENRVTMLAPDGTSRVLCDMPVANPITYHQGRLIAGELRPGGSIMEIDRNGGAPRPILADVPMSNAFEVGPDGKLYFPVMGMNEIWRVSLDGGEPEVVAKDLGLPDSVKFDRDGFIVSTQVMSGQVLRIDPRNGDRTVLADIGAGLDNCSFVGDRLFVSHIGGSIHEIVEPGKIRPLVERGLAGPMDLAIGPDGTLFVADGGFTYTMSPGSGGGLEVAGMLFTPGFPGFTRGAVAGANAGEWIVTTATGLVARWRPAAQEHDVLASGYDQLMGVAVAPGGAVVFAQAPTGSVFAVEGGTVSTLASGLDTPIGVAVGADGICYVSESGAGGIVKIVGGKAETVLDGLQQPQGMALRDGTLYIVDVRAKELIALDLATGARTTIAARLPVGAPPGVTPRFLGGVGDMCGPMIPFTGLTAAPDGTLYVSASGEGSIWAIRPA
ncbi:MAG TPA: PQQ-binding-like beta-propeller repeat protein, partial [Sphingobium sp.]|nr:PQQ-binding-like beta-propeller repeat protein [Sphingobium sp.]